MKLTDGSHSLVGKSLPYANSLLQFFKTFRNIWLIGFWGISYNCNLWANVGQKIVVMKELGKN